LSHGTSYAQEGEHATLSGKLSPRTEQALLFARNFVKHPFMLGSFIPSSRFLVNHLLRQVDWEQARVLVEYGPGVGSFTAEILRRMRPDARLVAIETNADFVRYLKTWNDPRMHVVKGSAAEVTDILGDLCLEPADYIISGIPYSTLPPELRDAILRASHAVLREEGEFLLYQFTGAVLPYLRRVFGYVRQDFELLNILPARLYYCTR
jgi:phospholipid N-methyltransferase